MNAQLLLLPPLDRRKRGVPKSWALRRLYLNVDYRRMPFAFWCGHGHG